MSKLGWGRGAHVLPKWALKKVYPREKLVHLEVLLGGMSLGIYLLEGGGVPSINAGYAFGSPIAIELLLVPLAFGIGWLELARFYALRRGTTVGIGVKER